MSKQHWVFERLSWVSVCAPLFCGCGGASPAPEAPPPASAALADDGAEPSAQNSEIKQAIAAIEEQRFEEAKALFLKAQARDSKKPEIAFYLGVAYEGLNDTGQAAAAYRQALNLDARMADAAVNLSALLINEGAVDEALGVIEQGLKSSPGHEGLLNNRAMVLSQTGKTKEAAETYAELLQKRPDDVEIKALYAEALLNAGENERALKVARSLLASSSREVLALAADLFGRSKAFTECVEALDKAIAIQDAAELRVRRGICHHGKNDEAKAQADFQTASEMDPKSAAAFYYLGQSWVALGKPKQAKAALTQAVALAGDTGLGKAAQKALSALK